MHYFVPIFSFRGAVVGKRLFLVVLDSVGIGAEPDANLYEDEGTNTLASAATSQFFDMKNMCSMGLFNIDGVDCRQPANNPVAAYARVQERSKGKDTTIGHWEIAGIHSERPLPTFPNGFPEEIIDKFEKISGKKILCNKPYSGTKVLEDYGKQSVQEDKLIVYTSADSVFQVAAHEDKVPVNELYDICVEARKILRGEYAVGRVIARPFVGEYPNYVRTSNRHDFSLEPPEITMLDQLKESGYDVVSVGKIVDIFAEKGITEFTRTKNNEHGIEVLKDIVKNKEFNGLCFVNLVDFDMLWGHRNDIDGYAKGLTYFDSQLPQIMQELKDDDILMITADHGCDPGYLKSTDHSREYIPWIIYGNNVKSGINLGTLPTFSDIGATILDYFAIEQKIQGTSRLANILK